MHCEHSDITFRQSCSIHAFLAHLNVSFAKNISQYAHLVIDDHGREDILRLLHGDKGEDVGITSHYLKHNVGIAVLISVNSYESAQGRIQLNVFRNQEIIGFLQK